MALLAAPTSDQKPINVGHEAAALANREANERREQIKSEFNRFKSAIEENDCVIFSTTVCPYCDDAKEYMSKIGRQCKTVELDFPENKMLGAVLAVATDQRTVPNIFVKGRHLGGLDGLLSTHEQCARGAYAQQDIKNIKGSETRSGTKMWDEGRTEDNLRQLSMFQRPICEYLMNKL